MKKRVDLVDLVKSFLKRVFTRKIWLRYSRERASQSLPKISQKLEQISTKVRKIIEVVPHVRLIRARREAADEERLAVAVVGPPGLGGRARLKLNDQGRIKTKEIK